MWGAVGEERGRKAETKGEREREMEESLSMDT